MGRLIDWPELVGVRGRIPLTGPRAVSGSSSESIGGYVQTVAGVFGLWRWQLDLTPMRGEAYRRYRGTVAALHGGSNALRVPFYDPDGIHLYRYTAFDNGLGWSNGAQLSSLYETVSVADDHALGASVVELVDEYWGHVLGVGDQIGFGPLHFGLYMVTQVIAPGEYRVWPPLRKALVAGSPPDYATLLPTMAMKLESEAAASAPRGLEAADGCSMVLVEVLHSDVIDYFQE